MNKFENELRARAKNEQIEVPYDVRAAMEKTLNSLPKKNRLSRSIAVMKRAAVAAACAAFAFLVLMPNISSAYAHAVENIPVIGRIVNVVTIRKYFYSDDKHEMNIKVPQIDGVDGDSADFINKDIDELTEMLSQRFNEELREIGGEGHSAVYVDYDIVTNTDSWFTLKVSVHEAAGSSNTYYKYYHIDKMSGNIVKLGDLALNDEFYTLIRDDIKRQMREEMEQDPDIIYWVDDPVFGAHFIDLGYDHGFYWNDDGDIVIVFDKYEVAPGYMGTPEFTVEKELIESALCSEYR